MTADRSPRREVADRFSPFGTTIFAEMTRLAIEHEAVNLSQGFPDFDGPEFIKDAAAEAIARGANQYARTFGIPPLTGAIADSWADHTGARIDPHRTVTVTSGCTEALMASFLGLINPGDEVVLFEPFYDSYRACVAAAGAVPRFVPLHPPAPGMGPDAQFAFEEEELRSAFSDRTRAILLNTPHNPTGKVFTRAELDLIADLCRRHDAIAITDEVYEHLTFEPDLPHIRLATLPGMGERTVTLSSLGKTFSLTGWKIGWAIAPEPLTVAIRSAHQFITFATATPLQHAAAVALREGGKYIAELAAFYADRRRELVGALGDLGFRVFRPAGTYFVMADHSAFGFPDDAAFCRHLISEIGVAAIPPSAFYAREELGRPLVRFAFCKQRETMQQAIERLGSLKPSRA